MMEQATPRATTPTQDRSTPRRAHALDALRGLAILAMVWSALVPYGRGPYGMLPSWMYHAQNPPPLHEFRGDLPGITWVDLVFPFFLFSMGAAIPLALSRRLDRGASRGGVIAGILWRGVLLVAFAYYREHVSPYAISAEPTAETWLSALAAMALVFMVWGRFPADWSVWRVRAWHAVGWVCAIVLLMSFRYENGANLAFGAAELRRWAGSVDIIILVLANVSVFGSLIWLWTRRSWNARLAATAVVLALKVSSAAPGWTRDLWAWTPAPWLYRMEFLKYLMIVLPATIIGDLLAEWTSGARSEEGGAAKWPMWRFAALGALAFAVSAVLAVGLTGVYQPEADALAGRAPLAATLVTAAVLGAMAWLARNPGSELERLSARLTAWGAWWVAFGLLWEPFEGGIQKGRPTIAYFFTTLGLGILMLLAFVVLLDAFRGRRAVGLLLATGQNPLLAYIGHSNLIMPLWVLSGMNAWMAARLTTPWQGALHAALLTLLLAIAVSGLTRLRVFVRA